MSIYTQGIARRKFAGHFGQDHLSGSAFRKKKTMGADGVTEYTSEINALSGDRKLLREGKISRDQWVARWPNEKAEVSTGLIGGITNVVKDAVKLAVAPVTLATGKDVKLTTGIGKVVGDSAKIAVSPIKQGISSITGKPIDLKMQTKAGKVVGGVTDIGGNALHSLAKGFADTVTLGYATKAANLIRKDENKEKAFAYNEMKQLPDTGIKVIDKVGAVLPTVSAAIGGAAAGIMGGTKIADMLKKDSNLKETNVAIGDNVLTGETPPPNQPLNLMAGSLPINPLMILGIIAAVVVLVIVAKKYK